ncbi:MAG: phage holin family protein [Isosphaeraceae bacterium]
MSSTKPMNDRTAERASSNGNGVVGGLTDFGNDVFTLAELQARLVVLDLKECVSRATVPSIVLVGAVMLALGAVPVALLGIAELLATTLGIRAGWAMLLVAFSAILLAGVVLAAFSRRLTGSVQSFRRSTEEFVRNIAWIRTVVLHSGRGTPNRSR